MGSADAEDLARRFLAALSSGDQDAFGELVHPEVEIHTARTVHRGLDAAVEWSGKGFDHIFRRYEPRKIHVHDRGATVDADLQYVWRETGEVADTSGVVIELGLRDGLVSSWELTEVEGLRRV